MKLKFSPLILSIFCLYLSSCISYQHISVSSNRVAVNDKGDFMRETDSLIVRYYLSGYDCPVVVEVFNKTNKPMYIDWRRSAIIYKDLSISFIQTPTINAAAATTTFTPANAPSPILNTSSSYSEIYGEINQSQEVSFIPPRSYVRSRPLTLESGFLITAEQLGKKYIAAKNVWVRSKQFSYDETPMKFRSHITVTFTDDLKNATIINDEFWVNEVIQTTSSANDLYSKQPANQFTVSKLSEGGLAAGAVIGLTAIVLIMVAGFNAVSPL
jgi:hypothetical protein